MAEITDDLELSSWKNFQRLYTYLSPAMTTALIAVIDLNSLIFSFIQFSLQKVQK